MVATAAEHSAAGSQSARRRLWPRVRDDLFSPRNIAGLVYFRIAFGVLVAWEVWRYVDPNHAWIQHHLIKPDFHFTYWPFDFVAPLPGAWMYALFGLLGVAAVFVAAGLFYRVATTVQFVALAYVFLVDRAQYFDHFYLICLFAFLLIFVPAHRAFSLDAARLSNKRAEMAPAWSYYLLRFQVAVPYIFAGLAKLNYDWLVRGEPLRQWLADRADLPVIGSWFGNESLITLLASGAILVDLAIVPLLLFRRTRVFGLALAVVVDLVSARLFLIGISPWLMIAATLIFLPSDWPRALIRDLGTGRRSVTFGFVGGAAVGVALGVFASEGVVVVAALVTGLAVGVIGAEIGRMIDRRKNSAAQPSPARDSAGAARAELAVTRSNQTPERPQTPDTVETSAHAGPVIEPIAGADRLPMSEGTHSRIKAASARLRSHRKRRRLLEHIQPSARTQRAAQIDRHPPHAAERAATPQAPPSPPPGQSSPPSLPPPTLGGQRPPPRDPERLSQLTQAVAPQSRNRAVVMTLLAIWVALQIAIPLRHLAVPGDVAWTDDGNSLAWRMKLRDKDADIAFVVTDTETGETFIEDPRDYLTARQTNRMARRPEMIVQFAHELERRLADQGHEDIRIRAHSFASLNGRPRQPFIRPDVDLTEVSIPGTFGEITVPLEPAVDDH